MGPKTQALSQFLQEAHAQFSDLLTLDAQTAWKARRGDRPMPHGLQTQWRRAQAQQAALRALKAVALFPLVLETPKDRSQLATALVHAEQEHPDAPLVSWLRGKNRVPSMQLFEEEIERLFPAVNIAGYRAIATEATRLGWPISYREDLTDIDRETLCTPGAPQHFWWGIRSTGTDLFRPNELLSMEWALARQRQGPGEQRHYHYTGLTLHPIELATLVAQLARSLHPIAYEQRWKDALTVQAQVEHNRSRDGDALHQAAQAALQAEKAYRKVTRLKQQYS